MAKVRCKEKQYFYGYKDQVSLDAGTKLVTSVIPGHANDYDGHKRKWHGFVRCRYTGFIRHTIQSYLTFMALNLKRLVKLLTGVSFRGEVRAYPVRS